MKAWPKLQVLVPMIWGCGCLVSYAYPGDEYAGFVMGSIVGTWTLWLSGGQSLVLPLVVGCLLMLVVGGILDKLSGSRVIWGSVWLLVLVLTLVVALSKFDSLEHARAKNGSMAAYLAFASQVGTYVATLAAFIAAAVRACAVIMLPGVSRPSP